MHPITIDTYRQMLRSIVSSRRIITYPEVPNHDDFILWRHDCDMSLNRALEIARIDQEFGVRSTFFIMVRSNFYNILEKTQTDIVREIVKLGHEIGLHFDASYHNSIDRVFNLEDSIIMDSKYLEDVAQVPLDVFSFHNPSSEILENDNLEYGGLINCYSKYLRQLTDYGSDSNGYWRHEPIPEILKDEDKKRLQILTHPEWWLQENFPPRDHVLRCAYGRAVNTVRAYDEELARHSDRKNVGVDNLSSNDYERFLKIR
jgi:peptidoglycan/xylan/chitin deacetylase (PgdA/CDA1 family)